MEKETKITTKGLKCPSLSAIEHSPKIVEAGTICYAPQLEVGCSYKVVGKEKRVSRDGHEFFVNLFCKV